MKTKLYLVTGISGSGKTTVARYLLQHGEIAFDSKVNSGLYHFVDENGVVASSIHIQDEAWRAQYKWSLNEEMLETLLKENNHAKRVFLCGRANLFQYWHKLDGVFLLKVNEQTLRNRLNSETRDNLFAKDVATQEYLVNQLDAVQEKIASKGAIVIDANLPIEEVIERLLSQSE